MRRTKHHGLQRSEYDHVNAERDANKLERDRVRADIADETVCSCGWITARTICPQCGCVRVPESIGGEA